MMNKPVTAEIWKQNAIVERYLSYHAAIPLAREQIEVMLTLLATRSEPVKSFLDLGCGSGILGAAILEKYPNSRGVLADFAEKMLQEARSQLDEFAHQLQFVNLDYANPAWVEMMDPFQPFDAVVSRFSIHHQPDERKKNIYKDTFGLLAPGGWFINIEQILPSASLAGDLLNTHIIEGRYAIEVQNGGSKTKQEIADTFLNRPDLETNLVAPVETQCEWLREIGYEQVDCYFRIYDLAVIAGRKAVETGDETAPSE